MFDYLKEFFNNSQAKERYEICLSCPQFKPDTTQCQLCGCWMKAKVLIPIAKCPINKWQ